MSEGLSRNEERDMENQIKKVEDDEAPESINLIQVIERAALNPNIDVDKMERLLAMQERIVAKQAEADFNMAMSDAQGEMGTVAADATNPQTKSKYASYAALDRSLRPIYTKHGLSLSFDTGDGAPENCVRVICHVGHRAGHTRIYHADMPADGKGAKGGDVMTKTHATGSAYTYAQRYLLKLIFNIAVGDDDDGNSAGTEKLSVMQADTVKRLLSDLPPEETKPFLEYMEKVAKSSVESVEDIPVKHYDNAISALNTKITAVKKEKPDE